MRSNLTSSANTRLIDENLPDQTIAVYIHIPFCSTRCTYCAFNTYIGQTHLIEPYARALERDICFVAQPNQTVNSIYFGGGTPSLMPAAALSRILAACADVFTLTPDIEITLEANPGSVDHHYFEQLRGAGINRLSLGMQSAHQHELQMFARTHSHDDVHAAVLQARRAGFENISLDLIYGNPHQALEQWRATLHAALALEPDHISLYSLGIEDATPLQRQITQGRMPYPDPDLAADMYDLATDTLAAAAYEQYEISNWAKPGHACRHNLHVWHNLPYLGFGAGAHGYAAYVRYVNTKLPARYIAQTDAQHLPLPYPFSATTDEVTYLTQADVIAETLIMGLRLVQDGISYPAFTARFGYDLDALYGSQIDRLVQLGLLERTPDRRVRLTQHGRLLGNQVFAQFI